MARMPKSAAPRYRITNWSEYNAALKRRGSLEIWFDPGMARPAAADSRPSRLQRLSDSAIELCLTLKALSGPPLRQVTGLVASLLKFAKLYCPIPDTRRCVGARRLSVTFGTRPSSGGLYLLVDSTGITIKGEGEWQTRKHGVSCRRQWRKVHLGTDAKTMEIRAIEIPPTKVVTLRYCQICWRRSRLMSGSQPSARTARMTRGSVIAAIAERHAEAVIPVRRNGQPWKEDCPGVDARNEALRAIKRLGRKIWKKWSGYHGRSLVETEMHCFKLLGPRVASRTLDRQTIELKVRAKFLDRFSQIESPTTIRIA